MTASTSTGARVHVSHRVLAIHPDADVATALDVMRDNGVRHLPAVRGHLFEGLVTETDLLRAIALTAHRPPGSAVPSVGSVCHRRPPIVTRDASLHTIATAILAGGLDAALVVHGGALNGIVTSTDVLNAVIGEDTGT